jgi:colanic acid/amylovoran biosynthesis glycosyltransferase
MPIVVHSVHRWLPQTETWLYNQVRFLPPTIESHIVCQATENLDQFAVPNIHSLEEASRWRRVWDRQLRRLRLRRHFGFLVQQARQHRAQLLHSHFGNAGWNNLGAARRAALKHVVTFYGFDVTLLPQEDKRWISRYRELFAQVKRVLCEGPHMAQRVMALGCPQGKLRVHHLGVSVAEIAFRPRSWTAAEPLRVLIAASFREKKGIPYALEALGRFQQQVPVEITIVGDASRQASSQAEKQKILATIDKFGLRSNSRMLGYLPYDRCFEEAYKHHLFVSPSVTASDGDTEGGAPLGIIEMAATGMPVLSTTHCDIPSVIQHGVTGFLASERDVKGLIEGLKWWTEHPERWPSVLKAGRSHIEQEYDARRQGERLASIYLELMEG